MNQKIVNIARSWLNTPFKHQGRVKGVGCDCLGLLIGIAHELGLKTKNGQPIAELDCTGYHIIASGHELKQKLDANLVQSESLEPGALVLLEFDANPQHLAIIADNQVSEFNIIHADLSRGMVVEHNLSDEYRSRIKRVYQLSDNKEVEWHQ